MERRKGTNREKKKGCPAPLASQAEAGRFALFPVWPHRRTLHLDGDCANGVEAVAPLC